MKDVWLLIAGIPLGVIANFLYQYVRHKTNGMFDPTKMTGYWGELMATPGERRCSLGEIRYDRRKGMWTFDGTNYHNDGRPYCHWTTEASYLDKSSREFYYIFTNTMAESGETGYTGFGVIRFRREGKAWIPDRGFFVSGAEEETYRSHSMVPLKSIPRQQYAVVQVFKTRLGLT